MPAQEILSILSRLEAAVTRRSELATRRTAMIAEFKRTNQRVDSAEFAQTSNDLRTTEMEIAGLQGALDAFKAIGGGQ